MSKWCFAIVLFQSLFLASDSLIASAVTRFYRYPCILELEPTPENQDKLWPNSCVWGEWGLFGTQEPQANKPISTLNHYGKLYMGLALVPSVSFHYLFRGGYRAELKDTASIHWNRRDIEQLFLQLGNSSLSANYLAIGRIALPFGLDDHPFAEIFGDSKNNYWDQQKLGMRITRKNNNDTRYEIGVSIKESEDWQKSLEKSQGEIYSVRASIDLAALEGTKVIGSGQIKQDSSRKYGLALLNQSQGAKTSLEWLRYYDKSSPEIDYQQLFRLNYKSRMARSHQYVFQYENDRLHYWQSLLQLRYHFFRASYTGMAIGYRRGLSKNTTRGWIASIGISTKF